MSTIVTLPDGTKIESAEGPKQAPKGTEDVSQALGPVQEDKAVQPPQDAPQGPQKRRMPQVGETIDVPGFGTQPVTYEMLSDPQTAAAAFALYNNDPTVKELFNATGGGPTAAPRAKTLDTQGQRFNQNVNQDTGTSEQVDNTGFSERDQVQVMDDVIAPPTPTGPTTQQQIDSIERQNAELNKESLLRLNEELDEGQTQPERLGRIDKLFLGLQTGFGAAAGRKGNPWFMVVKGNKKQREDAVKHNRQLERNRDKILGTIAKESIKVELTRLREKLKNEEGTGQVVNGLTRAPFLTRDPLLMQGFTKLQSDLNAEAIALQEAYRNNPSDSTLQGRAAALAANVATQEALYREYTAKSRTLLPYITAISKDGNPKEMQDARNTVDNVMRGKMTTEDAATALAQIQGVIEDREEAGEPEDVSAEIQRFEKELNRLEGYIPQTEEDLELKERGFTYGTERDALRSATTIEEVRSIGRDLVQKTNDRIRRLRRPDAAGERQESSKAFKLGKEINSDITMLEMLVRDSKDDEDRKAAEDFTRLIAADINMLEKLDPALAQEMKDKVALLSEDE